MRPSVEELEEALEIPLPGSDRLYMEDSRRLTGPGLLWDKPGAIIEVVAIGWCPETLANVWHRQARRVLDGVGWNLEQCCSRPHENGINLAISAPMDQLYSAIFVAQAAWHYCASELLGTVPLPFEDMIADLNAVMVSEANPALISLQSAAAEHGVDFISDDDEVSLGHGCGSQTWAVSDIPPPGEIDWPRLHDVPVAMVTGTNGKSTCVRLAAAVATAAGKVAGVTSTDFVRVGDTVLDKGDYSGPGGARMLLRDSRLQVAFLEVARGGILRRGLALYRAQAALVTNVAADHLGQYGINTVPALIEAKFSVFRTLAPGGVLVLNADDAGLVTHARSLRNEIALQEKTVVWFSLHRDNPCIVESHSRGLPCGWLQHGVLHYSDGKTQQEVIAVVDVPITMDGAATYNVQNALGVMCLCIAFSLPVDAVRKGLGNFHSSPKDNPGRCNEFEVKGARVFVDFAHNPHSIAAVAATMKNIPAKRRLLMIGHAGDRSDEDINALTAGAFALQPEHIVIVELPEYLRGRESGEVSEVIRQQCLRGGLQQHQMSFCSDPLQGAARVLELLAPGDLALLLVHSQRDQVIELICHTKNSTR
jgi:cyanophycin synthetase